MAEATRHGSNVDACSQKACRDVVPEVMETDARDACRLQRERKARVVESGRHGTLPSSVSLKMNESS